jgi:uncharacterized membrane protein (Fun14 family)
VRREGWTLYEQYSSPTIIALIVHRCPSFDIDLRRLLITSINKDTHRHERVSGLREGLFVLLGLLLGFTIAMVLPRYDQRRAVVTDEAVTISAVWMQAQLLPEPQRSKSQHLLREYVAVRRQFGAMTLGDSSALHLAVAAFQAFIAGYTLKRKVWMSLLVTPLVIAVVVGLIADLDDPHTGLIRIEQSSMNRLANDIMQH